VRQGDADYRTMPSVRHVSDRGTGKDYAMPNPRRLHPREAVVDVEIRYRTDEPPLGTLGVELLEIDRGIREAIREARREEAPRGREGWPSLSDSVRVVRAETRSPLSVEATGYFIDILSGLTTAALIALIKKAISNRFKSRPEDREPIEIVIKVQIEERSAEDRIDLGAPRGRD
jgi:hypothetical protein